MPANNDFPVLNGIAPSWADVKVSITPDGQALIDMKDIKSINTSSAVEVGEQRAGGRVMKHTTGSKSDDASMTLYRDGYVKLLRGLKTAAPLRGNTRLIRYVTFGIDYQFTPEGSDDIYERRVKGCFIAGSTDNPSEGTDPSEVEVPLKCKEIVDVIDGEEVAAL
jgi:hypothetical protein